jgi:hypothetical protein
MINIDNKGHILVIISSLDKIYKQSKMDGTLRVKGAYLLDAIYKLLIGFKNSIDAYQRELLLVLYNKILKSSKYVCSSVAVGYINPKILSDSNDNTTNGNASGGAGTIPYGTSYIPSDGGLSTGVPLDPGYVVTISGNTVIPITRTDRIYTWQASGYNLSQSDILDDALNSSFLNNQIFYNYLMFSTGVEINFTKVGRIAFVLSDIPETDNYKIYDILNNDVTHSFAKTYDVNTRSLIFISNNIFGFNTITFSIKIT